MSRTLNRFISVILVLALSLSMCCVSAGAVNAYDDENPSFIGNSSAQSANYDKAEIARHAYYSLSPEARSIFDQMLAIDPVTRAYHIENVDSTFNTSSAKMLGGTRDASLTTIVNQLTALSLPSDVLYSLEAVAAGIIAALADGPLPFGDLLLLVATAGAAVIVAVNWNSISTKWTSIVNIFKNAFTSISTIVEDTFDEIQGNLTVYQNVPTITSNGKVATIGSMQYNCLVRVADMTQGQRQHDYYVAVRWGNDVYFDASKPITQGFARAIVAADNSDVGILATSQTKAIYVAQPQPIGPEISGGGSTGYYYHYHNAMHRNCHIWFV